MKQVRPAGIMIEPDEAARSRSFAIRIAVFYGAIFTVLGVSLPYMPLWLKWRGLSPFEIGLATSLPLFVRIVTTPMIGSVADRWGSVRPVMIIAAVSGLLSALFLQGAGGLILIVALLAVFQVASMAMMPLAEVVAMQGVRERGLDYGRMRLWGSLAFIAANLLGGAIIAEAGSESVMPVVIGASLLVLAAAWQLPADNRARTRRRAVPFSHLAVLLHRRGLAAIMFAAGIIQASHAVYYAFSAIHWQALGIDERWFGVLWGTGVISEVALFMYAGHAMARIGAVGMLGLGAGAGVIRWTLMAFDPSFAGLFALQLLHGLTFGATHLGAVHPDPAARRHVPCRKRPDPAFRPQRRHNDGPCHAACRRHLCAAAGHELPGHDRTVGSRARHCHGDPAKTVNRIAQASSASTHFRMP